MDATAIEHFLHQQVAAWNAGDKEAFFATYRAAAPGGLNIEYVGRPATDGWPVLEQMWTQQSARIEIEEVAVVVNGNEAACHNRNKLRDSATAIETVEFYHFGDDGSLNIRYFVQQP